MAQGNGFVAPGDYWILVNTTERTQQLALPETRWWGLRLGDVRAGREVEVEADGWMTPLPPFEVRILGPLPPP